MTEISVFLRHAKRNHTSSIDLSNRSLSFIPKQLFGLRFLEHLNLSNNKIQTIQNSILELTKIREIDLRDNQLKQIPYEITMLPLLQTLRLDNNPLGVKFAQLLQPNNQTGVNLKNTLKTCFQKQSSLQTPLWLREGNSQNLLQNKNIDDHGIKWDESIFKIQPKVSRKAQRIQRTSKKVQPETAPIFNKNNVLQLKMQDIQILQQISMGGFSTIHRGKYCNIQVAIKKVFNPNITEQLMNQFQNQITMLSRYRHPNIVLLIGAITKPPNLCILMEYCKEGTLHDLLHRKKTVLSKEQKQQIARQIINGFEYLHKNGIAHRDIKSHNILVNSYFHVKICDFGLARHKSQLNTGPMQYSGTPTYMSQQLFLKKAYDISVDVFALGTLLYQLYTGEVPYQGCDPADIKQKVIKDSSLSLKAQMPKAIWEVDALKVRKGQAYKNWGEWSAGECDLYVLYKRTHAQEDTSVESLPLGQETDASNLGYMDGPPSHQDSKPPRSLKHLPPQLTPLNNSFRHELADKQPLPSITSANKPKQQTDVSSPMEPVPYLSAIQKQISNDVEEFVLQAQRKNRKNTMLRRKDKRKLSNPDDFSKLKNM